MPTNNNKTVLKKTKITKSTHKDRLMVLVENLGDEIKLVAEGNLMLQEKMDAGFKDTNQRFTRVEEEMRNMNQRLNSTQEEMHIGFKTIIEALVKNETETAEIKEAKADKQQLLILEKRVEKLEIADKQK